MPLTVMTCLPQSIEVDAAKVFPAMKTKIKIAANVIEKNFNAFIFSACLSKNFSYDIGNIDLFQLSTNFLEIH